MDYKTLRKSNEIWSNTKHKKEVIVILFTVMAMLFFPYLVSASIAINPDSININKTYDEDYFVDLEIKNNQPFDFFNLEFETNSFLSIPKINELKVGETKTVKARIFSNQDVQNQNIRLKGFYNSSVGPSNLFYDLDVSRNSLGSCSSGSPHRDYDLIIGDTLRIKNTDTVNLRVYLAGNQIAVVEPNSIYSISNLNVGTNFVYRLEYAGHISSVSGYHCFVDVKFKSDTELITRREYDGILTLNLKNFYDKTVLNKTFLETDYNTTFYSSQEGVFVLRNTGQEIAKDITISASDWISFNPRIFDLEPGQSRTVTYIIKPKITHTNQTGKKYLIPITISGNFDTLKQNISVFVQKAEIGEEHTASQTGLIDFITQFCNDNPTVCNTEPRIVYRSVNESDSYFNATLGEQQLRDLFTMWLEFMNNQEELDTFYKEQFYNLSERMVATDTRSLETIETVKAIDEKAKSTNNVWLFISVFYIGVLVIGLIFMLIFLYKRRNKGRIAEMI